MEMLVKSNVYIHCMNYCIQSQSVSIIFQFPIVSCLNALLSFKINISLLIHGYINKIQTPDMFAPETYTV